MKKLMFSLMMLVAVNVMAEDNHLYIQSSTGETLDWSVPSLQKMTFQNGNVVVTMKNGTSTYTPISSVSRMYICTPSVNGIESVEGDVQCTWDGERLHVNAPAGSAVKVYSVNGVLVSQTRLTDTSVDLQGLNRGMYVVNVGGQVVKIMKK
ncbi:MAG: T9SS type A sorting domain-containing protein [Bacteroidaceae bacterium]|nr:T9SS type A sorting domain-containing protein [Bacteroidaceae bacterium]